MANEIARAVMRRIAEEGGYEAGKRSASGECRLSEKEKSLLIAEIHRGSGREAAGPKAAREPKTVGLSEYAGRPAGGGKQPVKSAEGMISFRELAKRK